MQIKIPYTNQDLPKTTIKLDVLIKYLRKGEALRSLFFKISFRIDIINNIWKKEPVKLYIYCIQTMNMSIYKQLSTFFYPLHHITISYPPYFKKTRRFLRRAFISGKIDVRQRILPGQMKQLAGLPRLNRRIRRTPIWQMKSYSCYFKKYQRIRYIHCIICFTV